MILFSLQQISFSARIITNMTATLSTDLLDGIRSKTDSTELSDLFNKTYEAVHYPPLSVYRTLFLCAAIDHDHSSLVTLLLSHPECDINFSFGYVIPSPLHAAVLARNSALVRVLLSAGASVNLESRTQTAVVSLTDAISAVESACVGDNPKILQLLLPTYDKHQTRARLV